MKKYKNIFMVSFVITCLLVNSCKTPQTSIENKTKKLPESYGTTSDTVCSASINWKTFYSDKYLVKLIDTALVKNYDVLISLQKIKAAQSDDIKRA